MAKVTKEAVRVIEVGPRDGLQNEHSTITAQAKIDFVNDLIQAGLRSIEVGAFVRPDRVPQMADTPKIYRAIGSGKIRLLGTKTWALDPNRKGMELALKAGVRGIAVFTAATESFAKKNIGMSIAESLKEFEAVIQMAHSHKIPVRGYVSTAFGCPFEGKVAPQKALWVAERLAELGVVEVSVGDTIGVATPNQMDELVPDLLRLLGPSQVALHLHDTRGTALANALRGLELGVRAFDSSAGGLGGCPFAPGAAGNLATEDLLYFLHGMGFSTGVDLERVCRASLRLNRRMKSRPIASRYLMSFME